ncbi:CGNR zinc finger domain-containing protein [Tunturiibacter empetritectus]|uniref:RNA-binding Zn ribbon-like protein n=1 Tax=Tunturiibacter lichenicola TaxID=2051959 RepID=A0A852VIP0_9BACT|nr:CGNR zinc finger domain-containing protein [Edaphobacter lichenicola]NYF91061.1 putative RNA-binding Zn ribbon-like protein [Edaphobacter lichenicola]
MKDRQSDVAVRAALAKLVASLIGGHLALDFCNTAAEHLAEQPDELLPDWESFVRWTVQVGLIEPELYCELVESSSPIDEVWELREEIYHVGLTLALGDPVAEDDLVAIREEANAPKPIVVSLGGGLHWRPDPQFASMQLRAILAGEALFLFCSRRSARIGICGGGLCGWLFLDESRGRRRRWCDMKDCGNREKARRYYRQQQKSK